MLIKPDGMARVTGEGHQQYKSAYWLDRNETPNERYNRDLKYQQLVNKFADIHSVPAPYKFFEVRIQHQSNLDIHNCWWNYPGFMDHIFWVFQKPEFSLRHGEFFYTLEPYETYRVIRQAKQVSTLAEPFKRFRVALIVPVEACEICMYTEFKGGWGEHRYPRPEQIVTQQEVDKQAALKEASDRVLANAYDLNESREWRLKLEEMEDVQHRNSKKAAS